MTPGPIFSVCCFLETVSLYAAQANLKFAICTAQVGLKPRILLLPSTGWNYFISHFYYPLLGFASSNSTMF